MREGIEEVMAGIFLTAEESLAALDCGDEPDMILPRKGGILGALLRSPLVGAHIAIERGLYPKREVDL